MYKKIYFYFLCFFLLVSCAGKEIPLEQYIVSIESRSPIQSLFSEQKKITSGVIVSPNNDIVTVAHGVGTSESKYQINQEYPGKLIKKYTETDIAFLITEKDFNLPQLTLSKPYTGEDIFTLSLHGKKTGTIQNITDTEFYVDILFTEGDSGGGVFNTHNELIGVIGAYDFEKQLGIVYKIDSILLTSNTQ